MRQRALESTRLVWDAGMEALVCEKCGEALYWDFGFRRCPYCHRRVTETQRCQAVSGQGHAGIIARRG